MGIIVGSLIVLCCGWENLKSFAKYRLFPDVSPNWLNELMRSMLNPRGTIRKDKSFFTKITK